MSEGITITVRYDEVLQAITGVEQHAAKLSANSAFGWLLECILIEFPEIEEKYPPGELYFNVNGYPPKSYSPLFEGDVVFFGVV